MAIEKRRIRTLIVDDDTSVVKLIAKILERRFGDRLELTATSNVKTALGLAMAKQVDLCITDLDMPQVNGMKCLKALKSANPLTQVIILTAHPNENAIRSAFSLGADDYLLKPIDVELLCMVVDFMASRFQRYHEEIKMKNVSEIAF